MDVIQAMIDMKIKLCDAMEINEEHSEDDILKRLTYMQTKSNIGNPTGYLKTILKRQDFSPPKKHDPNDHNTHVMQDFTESLDPDGRQVFNLAAERCGKWAAKKLMEDYDKRHVSQKLKETYLTGIDFIHSCTTRKTAAQGKKCSECGGTIPRHKFACSALKNS